MSKRKVEICIVSDIHLGTYGCHASEFLDYLKSIDTNLLILNGDIIDIWNFKKSYFPSNHMEVIRYLLKMVKKGTKVVYITGNHDDLLRKYSDFEIDNLLLVDKFIFRLGQKTYWCFHGDIFDRMTKGRARLLAKLGGKGYDLLILINRFTNRLLTFFGQEKLSLSKKIKSGVKTAVKWITDFEETAANLAIDQGYDYVICGHIHQPKKRVIKNDDGEVIYLNSGDWVENLTALEFTHNEWSIYHYDQDKFQTEEISDSIIRTKIRRSRINRKIISKTRTTSRSNI